ncbi:MAG: protein kinase [Eubacteriales bacterium]|nr:protein kinase [Eubacteriales bacterium]
MVRCMNCMKEYEDEFEVCPHCGFVRGAKPKEPYHLYPGMMLAGKYEIGTVIGFGGFGVIYKAWDRNLEKIVSIKEYYPTAFLSRVSGEMQVHIYDKKNVEAFEKGKKEFLEEARNLAKFNDHPNIVHVYDFFEENGTAYFVMEYLDGCNLKTYLQVNRKKGKKVSVDTALQITQAVLSALKAIHAEKVIHRDIKPGNIFICKDGTIKLIDFGAARFSDNDTEKTRTIIITPGYAPAEQYQTKSKQGPFTDIYATGAVLYEMLTGVKPEESINRKVEDTVEDPQTLNPEVPAYVSSAVMRAMAIQPEIRFQNVDQFAKALLSQKEVRDARREIRYRKRRRILRIAALLLLVAAAGVFCVFQYRNARKEAILEPAQLLVWTPYTEETGEDAAREMVESMAAEYLQNNPAVSIQVEAIAESEYEERLRAALGTEEEPDIFDSSCLTEEDYMELADLSDLFSFSLFRAGDYYFMEQYTSYFPSERQLPLSFDVPVLYANTQIEEGSRNKGDYAQFAAQEAGEYLGTTADYAQVQRDLAGIYAVSFPESADDGGIFTNLWSVSADADEAEYAAAIRLLYYFLSETAQDYLTVQNSNHLPVSKNVLQVYAEVNGDFSGLAEYVGGVRMETVDTGTVVSAAREDEAAGQDQAGTEETEAGTGAENAQEGGTRSRKTTELAAVPDVQGEHRDDAMSELLEAGFTVEVDYDKTAEAVDGEVLAQSVEPGKKMAKGGAVTLTVKDFVVDWTNAKPLEETLRGQIGKLEGDVYASDLYGVTQIDVSTSGGTAEGDHIDLEPVISCVNLKRLTVFGNYSSEEPTTTLDHLSKLKALGKLESINFGGMYFADTNWLEGLNSLGSLIFQGSKIEVLNGNMKLEKLSALSFYSSEIVTLQGEQIFDLRRGSLQLPGNVFAQIQDYSSMQDVRRLEIEEYVPGGLSGIGEMTALEELAIYYMDGCESIDFSELTGAEQLQTLKLDLSSVALSGQEVFETLNNLREVSISFLPFSADSAGAAAKIETINSVLDHMSQITDLTLYPCMEDEREDLSQLRLDRIDDLESLYLSGDSRAEISLKGAAGVENIKKLTLSFGYQTTWADPESLLEWKNLESLELMSGNPVWLEPVADQLQIKTLVIDGCEDFTYADIAKLENVETLVMQNTDMAEATDLDSLKNMKNLKTLILDSTCQNMDQEKVLQDLKEVRQLEHLYFVPYYDADAEYTSGSDSIEKLKALQR